jgi:hypothetical protein
MGTDCLRVPVLDRVPESFSVIEGDWAYTGSEPGAKMGNPADLAFDPHRRWADTMQGYSDTFRVNFRARSTLLCAIGIGILTMATFLAPVALGSPLITYTYTGNDFTGATGPYNTSDSVTGFFTYSALPDNLDGQETFPTAYTFTDGVQTYDMGNSGISAFEIWTNATGEITGWNIDLGSGADNYMWTYDDPAYTPGAQDGSQLENAPSNGGGWVNNDPGVWTESSTVPEPSSAFLVPTALVAIAFVARRRVGRRSR